jgi:MYXO-CTERM domain-containing protein
MTAMPRGRLLVLALLAGCAAPDSDGELQQAVGEPMNGYPTPPERLMLMAINRARSDPSTVKGAQSTIYPAVAPVLWAYDLSRSSRFHAINLDQTDTTLMHTSPCQLNANVGTSGCTGAVACACATPVPNMCRACANVPAVNTCGTDAFTRIGYFFPTTMGQYATGEVAAAGYADTFTVVTDWVDEPAGNDGHRQNLLDVGIVSNVMGAGDTTSNNCWASFDVSDSGYVNGLAIPEIPTASVNPVGGPAGMSYRFYATWADPVGGAPASLQVVVDGVCRSMVRELGSPTLNSTWYDDDVLARGCHSYWILGRDSRGGRSTYPTTGALTVAVGGSTCTGDYLASAPAASCEADAGVPEDLAAPSDFSMPPPPMPDLSMLPDLVRVPDLVRLPDLVKLPDLVRLPDLAAHPVDLSPAPADLTSPPRADMAIASRDLAIAPLPDSSTKPVDLALPPGMDLGRASDLEPPADLARGDRGTAPEADSSTGADGDGTGAMPPGCNCATGGRRDPRLPWPALGAILLVAARLRRRASGWLETDR